jgi:hypothetical protein
MGIRRDVGSSLLRAMRVIGIRDGYQQLGGFRVTGDRRATIGVGRAVR